MLTNAGVFFSNYQLAQSKAQTRPCFGLEGRTAGTIAEKRGPPLDGTHTLRKDPRIVDLICCLTMHE